MQSQSQKKESFTDQLNFEHRFWLQILGDHMRFIENTLAPIENDLISVAEDLKNKSDNLLNLARKQQDVTSDAIRLTQDIKEFKGLILNELLTGKIKIGLTPTFINHMINELEQYQKILEFASLNGEILTLDVLDQHKLWLLDAKGHTEALISDLDPTEKEWKKDIKILKKKYAGLYSKAEEFMGYLRVLTKYPPSVDILTNSAINETTIFISMLKEILNMISNKELLGRIDILVPDHMIREELYYLSKLGRNIGDPTTPRVSL